MAREIEDLGKVIVRRGLVKVLNLRFERPVGVERSLTGHVGEKAVLPAAHGLFARGAQLILEVLREQRTVAAHAYECEDDIPDAEPHPQRGRLQSQPAFELRYQPPQLVQPSSPHNTPYRA